ncbi:MAG: T9SS type A sorting domain-containing protein [Saprospiraceae bacterium]|nr:T9SS type A sorting domain-containing protein [Saprospiraceae bacterium]
MIKLLPVFAFLTFAACSLFLVEHKDTGVSAGLKIPSGEQEENPELRAEWEHARFADPATGEIPAGITFLERRFAADLPKAVYDRSAPDWQARGPWNVGGRTRGLAIDVANENRILAGAVSGGLWLSEDAGQSWARKTPLNAHPGCVSIAQDTRAGHTNTWYYISGEYFGPSASGGAAYYLGDGMFKSTDGGNTWNVLGATDNGDEGSFTNVWQAAYRVVTDPVSTQDVVYAASYNAIWRSTNGGTSWGVTLGSATTSPFSYATDVAITSTGVLYATFNSTGAKKGIWRSTNGTTWVNIIPANFPAEYDRLVIGINPNNENEVYFLGATPGAGHYSQFIESDDWSSLWKYTYISGNGTGVGGQWEDRSQNLPDMGTEFDRFTVQGGYDLVVKVQPGTNNVFVGGTSLFRSTDGFTTANNTTHIGGYKPGTYLPYFELYPNHHPDQHDLLFLPSDPNVMITASDGGLHRTENCNAANVTWTALNHGYQTSQFYTAIIDKNTPGDNTIIGGLQDNGNFFTNSADPTAPWKQTINGDGSFGAIAPNKAFYVISIQQGRLAKCILDNQGNVTAYQRFDPIGRVKGDYEFINPLALDPTDENILYLPAGDRFYRQDALVDIPLNNEWDSIATGWTKFPDTLTPINDNNGRNTFSAIAVSQANPAHRVYLGTSRNKIYRIDNADTGTPAFTALTSPVAASTAYVTSIAVDPDNADRVIVAFSNYGIYSLFLSENAGQNWIKVGGNLEANVSGTSIAPSIRWITMLPFPDGKRKYFCGTSIGLFSADTLQLHTATQQGTVWTLEAPDVIGSNIVDFVDVRPSDGWVVAATHGIGLFSATFSPASAIHEPAQKPVVQAFPNPARDIVRFAVPGAGHVEAEVTLFNQQGEKVRQAQIGGKSNSLDLSGLPVGVYLYELRGKNWRSGGKIVHTL